MLLKRTIKLLNYLLVGFTKFLNGVLSSISKVISPTWESFFYSFEKAKYICGKNLTTDNSRHEFQRLSSLLSTSLDLHIPPNLELILENW